MTVIFERVTRHLRADMDMHCITQIFGESHILGALHAHPVISDRPGDFGETQHTVGRATASPAELPGDRLISQAIFSDEFPFAA